MTSLQLSGQGFTIVWDEELRWNRSSGVTYTQITQAMHQGIEEELKTIAR
jgi:hypothetical protein